MTRHVFTQCGIASLALACATFILVGCGPASTGGASSASSAGSNLGAAPATLSADAILAKAKSAPLTDSSGTEQVMSKSPVTSITMKVNFKLTTSPSRFAFDGTSVSTVNGKTHQQALAAVFTDTDVYMQIAGVWSKTSTDSQTSSGVDFRALMSSLTQPQLVGVETINGHSAYHITGSIPAPTVPPGSNLTISPTTADYWVRQDNFYPTQMKFHLTSTYPSPITGKTETTNTDVIVNFTAWDTGATIALPQV